MITIGKGNDVIAKRATERFLEVLQDTDKREAMLSYASVVLANVEGDEKEIVVELARKISESVPTKEHSYGIIVSALAIALLTFMCTAEAMTEVGETADDKPKGDVH